MSGYTKNPLWQPGPWRPVNGAAGFGAVAKSPLAPRDRVLAELERAERLRCETADTVCRYLRLLSINPKLRTPKKYPRPRSDVDLGMAILRIAAGHPDLADRILNAIEEAMDLDARRWSAEARSLVIRAIDTAAARDKRFTKRKLRMLEALRQAEYVPWPSR